MSFDNVKSFKKYLERNGGLPNASDQYFFGIDRGEDGKPLRNGKGQNIDDLQTYMLVRTQRMFEWSGLPDTIDPRALEMLVQCQGYGVGVTEEGEHYILQGDIGGGTMDPQYLPTIATVSNPALNISKRYKINGWKYVKEQTQYAGLDEAVVVRNDSYTMGLLPLFNKYATLMAENELSIWMASINGRVLSYIAASDKNTKDSADKYLEDITDGHLGTIAESPFLDGINVQPNSNSATAGILQGLVELEQFLKASWYNELGLNANYNMKREAINSQEAQLNDDALLPLVDDMLHCRRQAVEQLNKAWGTNITVKLASSWEDNEEEIALKHGEMDAAGDGKAVEEKEEEKEEENEQNNPE